MPKQKTHRGAAKRFKVTGSGKVKTANGFESHLLTGKTRKRKRGLKKASILTGTIANNAKRLLNV